MKTSDIVRALDIDRNAESGLVRYRRNVVQPLELFVKVNTDMWFWVRASGDWVSGHSFGGYFGRRPGFINRWRIRNAVKRWLARSKPHLGPCRVKNYGDSMHCECGTRYDTNDSSPPRCPRTGQACP